MIRKIIALFFLLLLSTYGEVKASSSAACIDTDTLVMLHGDGVDASTTITDSSSFARTVHIAAFGGGDTQIDTAQSKFGGASILTDGTGDFFGYSVDAALRLDSGTASNPWTVDFWVRFNALAGVAYGIIDLDTDSTHNWGIYVTSGNALSYYVNGAAVATTSGSFFSTATWYHVAVVNDSGTIRLFKDGTQATTGTAVAQTASTSNVFMARNSSFVTNNLNGWLDEFRVVKGTAVWTSNFTPPTSAYADTCAKRRIFSAAGD